MSARDLADDLARYSAGQPSVASQTLAGHRLPPGTHREVQEAEKTRGSRGRLVIGAACLLALAVGAAWLFGGRGCGVPAHTRDPGIDPRGASCDGEDGCTCGSGAPPCAARSTEKDPEDPR